MEVSSYPFHRRALTAFNQLTDEEQAEMLDRLAALVAVPTAEWPAAQAQRLPGDQSLYLVRVNESLRIIVRVIDGQKPEVMDIVRHETLESFTKAAARSGR